MGNKFNFNSQVSTSRSQSERLLALGLKKETADMALVPLMEWDDCTSQEYFTGIYAARAKEDAERYCLDYIPAWSLHRIWVLMPKWIDTDKRRYYLQMNAKGDIGYFSDNYHALEYFYGNETIYDDYISCIAWLIKEGYFNKEYLKNGN